MLGLLIALLAPALAGGGPVLTVGGACPGRLSLDISGVTPGGQVVLLTSAADGAATIPGGPCVDAMSGLAGPLSWYGPFRDADADGAVRLGPTVGGGVCGLRFAAVDLSSCGVSESAGYEPIGDAVEFEYTGAIERWTVPDGVRSIVVDAWGAQGGMGAAGAGGLGAHARGSFEVVPGAIVDVLVGQQPAITTEGGHEGNSTGGGGGTFVVLGDRPLLIAGGGGGGGAVTGGEPGLAGEAGGLGLGDGGGPGGVDGDGAGVGGHNSGRGGAGFYTDGSSPDGDCGVYCCACGDESSLSFLAGGAGGPLGPHHGAGGFGGGGCGGNYGGGGGGGYSGGGSGSSNGYGGGGGGSFNSGAAPVLEPGVNAGHGRVVVTLLD